LLGEGRFTTDTKALLEGYAHALREDGVPVDRMFVVFPTLHPQARAVSYVWTSQGTSTEEIFRAWGYTDEFLRSPIARIYDRSHDVIRRRICDPNVPRDFGVIEDLLASGFTDYLAAAMQGAARYHSPSSVTFATKVPDGFRDEDLTKILSSMQLLAPLVDTHIAERVAASLLNVYLGNGTGSRVLRGAVKRGDSENIHAVVCFADLRDFTSLSDRLPRERLLALLNDYFDCVVGAVQAEGGEVLKFIGDAVLAVFRADSGDEPAACFAAMRAAKKAFRSAQAKNLERTAAGDPLIDFGMSIHLGDVTYGNIGARDRLDFTVIGPTVNLASRIQGLCRSLGRNLLMSEAVMACARVDADDLGSHTLKGVAAPVRLFSPRG
jgi:adenylate cyclase